MSDDAAGAYHVVITANARSDLHALHAYLLEQAGSECAADWLDSLTEAIDSLHQFPERGSIPSELAELGISTYRQRLIGPYRLLYEVDVGEVIIHLIVDSRRDLGAVLMRRLLAQ